MRDRSSYESPRESSGKSIVIVIVIVTCTVSFALGYFVGKTNVKDKQEKYQIVAASAKEEAVKPLQAEQPAPNAQTNPSIILSDAKNEKTTEPRQPVQGKDKKNNSETVKQEKKDSSTEESASSYTVQAGAFKNQKDAEILKKKLEKKGHKAYIKKMTGAKNIKLYKVRVGSFEDKEEAEFLATRLKKEGFKPFITSKNKDAGK
ncbi:MAG: SPOR domain-containing protein [Nitrospiraceae bacterium]|nr:SPOR domain-containing protein [Nitrospiraceae bacterium]